MIKNRKGALTIVVEMHPSVWNSALTTRSDAEAILADLDLYPVPLTGQRDPLADHGSVHLAYGYALDHPRGTWRYRHRVF